MGNHPAVMGKYPGEPRAVQIHIYIASCHAAVTIFKQFYI